VFSSSYSNLPPLPHRLFLLLTVIWAGSLWTIGYLVAPTLFSVLPSRETAGMIAGHLFRYEAILGMTVGVLQLVLCNVLIRRGAERYRSLRWIVLAMLVCVLAGYFGVQPFMEGLKVKAQALNLGVSESPYKAERHVARGVQRDLSGSECAGTRAGVAG
jgi:glucan phosphoethanolaminetransferase (alkaline phosphatase superfamily)